MFEILTIDHIVLRTTQIDKMIHFYCDVLGCRIEKIQKDFGLTQLRAGDNIIDLISVDKAVSDSNRNLEHFCLRVAPFDFEALNNYFRNKGIEIYRYGDRYGSQGVGPSFYLKDPENNEIELKANIEKNHL